MTDVPRRVVHIGLGHHRLRTANGKAELAVALANIPDRSANNRVGRNRRQTWLDLAVVLFLLWCLLLFVCWPLALLVLVAYPLVWTVLLPFRLIGMTFNAVFDTLHAILSLPARIVRQIG